MHFALFVREGGGTADKTLSTVGEIGTKHEVKLTASTADLFRAGGFGADLAEQININTVVDRDKVVKCCDGADVVGVAHRCAHQLGVFVNVVVHLFGSAAESECLAVAVDALFRAVDLARVCDVDEGIHIHLRVYAEVF